MKYNVLTSKIHAKGHTLEEFLIRINRGKDWFYKHSNGGKQYELIKLAVEGLDDVN